MTQIAEAFVRIRPDTDGFRREVGTEVRRDLNQVERSLGGVDRQQNRVGRSGIFAAFGLSRLGVAGAAAGLAVGGLAIALGSTIGPASEAEQAEAQLANALDQLGISYKANQRAIEQRTRALSLMSGVDDELLTTTFTGFVRRTNDVTKALRLNAIAVDVARGRNLSLESAAALVTRASLGMAGALRRVGIEAENGASATELLELLQRKYAGSAEAYGRTAAGAQERFSVALENTKEIIGTALLPSLTKALDKASEWLNETENQERVQRFVESAARRSGQAIEFLADAYDVAARGAEIFGDASEVAFDVYKNLPLQRGIRETFEFFTRPPDRGWEDLLEDISTLVAQTFPGNRTLDAIEAIRALREFEAPPANLPDVVRGTEFLGTTATEAQRRAIELARAGGRGTDEELAALRAEEAADRKALAFATRMMETRGKNQRAFADEAIRLQAEITASQQRIAQILEERAQNARDARERVREANAEASRFVTELLDTARDRRLEEATRLAQERENRLERLTRVPAELELRTQIAEARATEEEQVVPFLRREAQALTRQIAELKRRDASLVQILQARVNLARVRRQIRDIDQQEARESGMSVQDFFSRAAGEFAALGSNVGAIDVALSPQEAGGAAVRAARSVGPIHQHFYGQQPNPAQALQQAGQAARALR